VLPPHRHPHHRLFHILNVLATVAAAHLGTHFVGVVSWIVFALLTTEISLCLRIISWLSLLSFNLTLSGPEGHFEGHLRLLLKYVKGKG
jgi:hypothetical protein